MQTATQTAPARKSGSGGNRAIRVLAVDPGWDGLGLALFHFALRAPTTLQDAVRGLRAAEQVDRLGGMANQAERASAIRAEVEVFGRRQKSNPSEYLVVEQPPFDGDYHGDKARRGGVNKLYMAIGAVLAAAGVGEPMLLPVVRTPKAERQAYLHAAGLSEDVRGDAADAVWIGAQWALSPEGQLYLRRGFREEDEDEDES
jgi:hypothetical protein